MAVARAVTQSADTSANASAGVWKAAAGTARRGAEPQVPDNGPRPGPAPLHHTAPPVTQLSVSPSRAGTLVRDFSCVRALTVLPPGVGLFSPLAAGTLRHDLLLH